MKRIITLILILVLLLSTFIGCNKGYEVDSSKFYLDYTIDSIIYETKDGLWDENSVENMIDKYYNEKSTVDLTIIITFTVDEAFDYATFTCKGGIGKVVHGNAFNYLEYQSSLKKDDNGIYEAGTYKISLQADDFCFYKTKGTLLPAFERERVEIITSLDVVKYNTTGKPINSVETDEYFTYTATSDGSFAISATNKENLPSKIIIPSTYKGIKVTQIAEDGFSSCNTIEEVVLSNNIRIINNGAFCGCSKLKTVRLSNSVTHIASSFQNCISLESFEYEGTMYEWECSVVSSSMDSFSNYYVVVCKDGYINGNPLQLEDLGK